MGFSNRIVSVLVALALLWGVDAAAQDNEVREPIVVDTRVDRIIAQQTEIRRDATAKRGRYRDMDNPTRERLLSEQDKVFTLLEGRTASTELNREGQLSLFNSLEAISAIVNRAEDERVVCERVRGQGTNIRSTVCKTVAQRRAERQSAAGSLPTQRGSVCLICDQ